MEDKIDTHTRVYTSNGRRHSGLSKKKIHFIFFNTLHMLGKMEFFNTQNCILNVVIDVYFSGYFSDKLYKVMFFLYCNGIYKKKQH